MRVRSRDHFRFADHPTKIAARHWQAADPALIEL